jgi:TonB family protein
VGLTFLVEPEPWVRIFLRNLADLFRPAPPPVWITARPAQYWPDAMVHRPAPWTAIRQSGLGHILAVLLLLEVPQLWLLEQPQVISVAPRNTIIHYQLSEYLPAVQPRKKNLTPPLRPRALAADPEYAAQEIVSIHPDHTSRRQTIIQPDVSLLKHDVPMPNMMVSSPIPGAPVATNRRLMNLPDNAPQVVPPSQQVVERNANRLIFPAFAQPEVVPPSSPVAANRAGPVLPQSGPVVIPPSEQTAARDPHRLQLAAQAPEVAAPPSAIASRHSPGQALPASAPEVVPPAQQTAGRRSVAGFGLGDQSPAVAPPPQPVAAGRSPSEAKAIGQLLALNAQPIAPAGPVTVPEGTRKGEFAAGPTGRPGATAQPETRAGANSSDANRGGDSANSSSVFVSAPPSKVTGDAVVAALPAAPAPRLATPDRTDLPADKIDTQVFGGRRRYSMKVGMANLNSASGSWTMRFAELHGEPGVTSDLSYPDPIKKVDPAYPANMVHDRIEGVVVLHAVIRADGTVGDVRVLEGFNDRLDENARVALEQWRFRPGMKNGVPVDVEAVVRVPFRVPKPLY